MNQIQWGQGRWLACGLLIAGLLVGVGYAQAPGGQRPPGLAPNAAAQSSSPDKVVLKVGDESLTQGEVDGFIQGLPPQAQRNLATQGRRPLGDEFVLMLVLSQEALKHHLDSTPAFQQMLALRRRQLLATTEYQEIMRQSVVTPEEISKYYAGHQSEFEETRLYQVVIRKKPEGAKEGTPGLTAEEAKTRAEEIRKAMLSGEDPKKLAERFQLPNVVRVDAEPFPVRRGSMGPDMEKAAFELKEGEVSEVFDVAQSLLFFKVASHKVRELSDVSSQIENTLQKQKVNSAVDDLKKNAKVWLDDGYFATPVQPGPPGAAKPPVPPGGPATPK
jgi:parvulin-like peptidyl-prolyl isomerase